MRILHVTDRLSDRGGAHRHLLGVLKALRERGHELLLAAGADDERVEPPCPVRIVPGLEARTRMPANIDRVAAALAPDLVHVHTVVNPAVLEWAARWPSVVTVQDHRYFCPARGKWTLDGRRCVEPMARGTCRPCLEDDGYFEEVYAITAERLAALRRLPLIVLSAYMKRELVASGHDPARIAVVPPFVDGLDFDAEPDGPACVLLVGRLSAAQGTRDAVAAWRRSRIALPLVAAGTGPLRAEVENAGVNVLGWLDAGRLSAAYRRARALLMSPRWQEPFGLAGLEALAMGVPVAAWDSGAVAEWHPGPLADWGDVEGLAAALREAIGRRAQAPSGFEREPLMDRLVAIYERVAAAVAAQ